MGVRGRIANPPQRNGDRISNLPQRGKLSVPYLLTPNPLTKGGETL